MGVNCECRGSSKNSGLEGSRIFSYCISQTSMAKDQVSTFSFIVSVTYLSTHDTPELSDGSKWKPTVLTCGLWMTSDIVIWWDISWRVVSVYGARRVFSHQSLALVKSHCSLLSFLVIWVRYGGMLTPAHLASSLQLCTCPSVWVHQLNKECKRWPGFKILNVWPSSQKNNQCILLIAHEEWMRWLEWVQPIPTWSS